MSTNYIYPPTIGNNSNNQSFQSPQRFPQHGTSMPHSTDQQEQEHYIYSSPRPRMTTNSTVYQPAVPMQSHRSPSMDGDFSQPPLSPLPPYIARPPPTVAPPQYYQGIHREVYDENHNDSHNNLGAFSYEQNNGWVPGRRERMTMGENEMHNRAWNDEDIKESKNRGECWRTLKDILELCPCLCCCCICFSAVN